MRDIKFRAWNKITLTMLKVMAIFWGSNPIVLTAYKFFEDWHIGMPSVTEEYREENYILMQYTGLKDKNGKEIFEGDVIKTNWYHVKDIIQLVTITTRGVMQGNPDKNSIDSIYSNQERDFEVIGNIYENPELISK